MNICRRQWKRFGWLSTNRTVEKKKKNYQKYVKLSVHIANKLTVTFVRVMDRHSIYFGGRFEYETCYYTICAETAVQ